MSGIRLLSILFFLLINSIAFSQEEDYSRDHDSRKSFGNSERKFVFGGGGGLQFGNPTLIELSPKFGYRLTENLLIGSSITYMYYRKEYSFGTYELNHYGGSVFANYLFLEKFFPHVEYELLNIEYINYHYENSRKWVQSVFVGGGYYQQLGANAFVQFMLLYNLTHDEYSPYSSPFVPRIGIYF